MFDSTFKEAVKKSGLNMLVPWYLMASFLYYHRDTSLLADETFDQLCKDLLEHWDSISHMHKHLIDKSSLEAGTGFAINEYPEMVKRAALSLVYVPPAKKKTTRKKKV